MPSRIDEAVHTKAFDYPVAEHWGESQRAKQSLVGCEILIVVCDGWLVRLPRCAELEDDVFYHNLFFYSSSHCRWCS